MLRRVCVRIASVTRKPRRFSAILMQLGEMIERVADEIGEIFTRFCPNSLRLKHLSSCQYNEIALKVFAQEEGAVPKW
jgi:hypothetical protein